MWLSLVERFVRDEEVACSNHVIPIPWQGHKGVRSSELFKVLGIFFIESRAVLPFFYMNFTVEWYWILLTSDMITPVKRTESSGGK